MVNRESRGHRLGPPTIHGVSSSGIGTLRETQLHASLKRWYSEPGDVFEAPIGRYVIDIVRGERLIEIQTRGFSAMRGKLDALLDDHRIRIVHPIPESKWIVRGPHDGRPSSRRKSPKAGSLYDVFAELVSFPTLLDHPNLSLELLLTHEEELRQFDGNRSRRRKGWAVVERRLLDVVDRRVLDTPGDLSRFLPDALEEPFTTADLARAIARPRRLAQQMAYCLREIDAIVMVGKTGNALEYRALR